MRSRARFPIQNCSCRTRMRLRPHPRAPPGAPRSSLILSDEPPNREQNYRTEFVVVLNNQPQGGLAIRKPPSDVVARDGYGYYGDGYGRQYGGPYGGTAYY